MTESPSESVSEDKACSSSSIVIVPEIPIEIVSDEEMALLEAALVSARSFLSSTAVPTALRSSHFPSHVRSVQSITALSKRGFPGSNEPDMEDLGDFRTTQKKTRLPESFLLRFRKKKGLSVTDLTSTVFLFFWVFCFFLFLTFL